MPLKLNVGLNRKVGEPNYGSRGASIYIEIELDSGLISKPAKLQDKIRQCFTLVRRSLVEELNGSTSVSGNNGHNGGSGANGSVPQPPPVRQATPFQIKAIHNMASARGLSLDKILSESFHVAAPENLTIKEASQLIGDLKSSPKREGG